MECPETNDVSRTQSIDSLGQHNLLFPNLTNYSLRRTPSPKRKSRQQGQLHHDIGFSDTVSNVVENSKHDYNRKGKHYRYTYTHPDSWSSSTSPIKSPSSPERYNVSFKTPATEIHSQKYPNERYLRSDYKETVSVQDSYSKSIFERGLSFEHITIFNLKKKFRWLL